MVTVLIKYQQLAKEEVQKHARKCNTKTVRKLYTFLRANENCAQTKFLKNVRKCNSTEGCAGIECIVIYPISLVMSFSIHKQVPILCIGFNTHMHYTETDIASPRKH